MKIAVCDDEPIFLEMIRKELEQYYKSLDVMIETFHSGEDLLRVIKRNPQIYRCIFLDIEMPGLSGLDTAEKVKEMGLSIPVILLTSHTEYAMQGYEVGAFRFLGKPVEQEKLHQALESVEKMEAEGRRLSVRVDGKDLFIPVEEILYLKSENVYLSIQTEKERYLIRGKIKDQLFQLPEEQFFQIHRSWIINLRKVYSYDGKKVFLTKGTQIPVGRNRRESFQRMMSKWVKEN